jgi:hypothetical protein
MFTLLGTTLLFAGFAGSSSARTACAPPPTAQAKTSPRVHFVALTHKHGEPVKLWEVNPELDERRAVCRHVLGNSHWNATPLLESPTFLRWQVPSDSDSARHGYTVKLFMLDLPSCALKELLATGWANPLGCSSSNIFLDTTEGLQALDVKTGAMRPQSPAFEFIASHGDDWLVVIDGALARFDAASSTVTRRYPAIVVAGDTYSEVTWNGGPTAVARDRFFDEQGEPVESLLYETWSIVYRELNVWDLASGTQRKLLVRTQAVGGSGIGVIPIEVFTHIEGGRLRYTERLAAEGLHASFEDFDRQRDSEWVVVDLKTGVELERRPYSDFVGESRYVEIDRFPVPDYLEELYRHAPVGTWGDEQSLGYAFLTHHGIELNLPTTGVRKLDAVCSSADGSELLILHRGTFYHGDVATRSLVQWSAPEEFRGLSVDLHAAAVE